MQISREKSANFSNYSSLTRKSHGYLNSLKATYSKQKSPVCKSNSKQLDLSAHRFNERSSNLLKASKSEPELKENLESKITENSNSR